MTALPGYPQHRTLITPQSHRRRRGELRLLITRVFEDSDQTYGYRRVQAELGRAGVDVGVELVRHLMGELDLVACQPRPFRHSLTSQDADQPAIADLVARDFTATVPGTKMIGDITYVPTVGSRGRR